MEEGVNKCTTAMSTPWKLVCVQKFDLFLLLFCYIPSARHHRQVVRGQNRRQPHVQTGVQDQGHGEAGEADGKLRQTAGRLWPIGRKYFERFVWATVLFTWRKSYTNWKLCLLPPHTYSSASKRWNSSRLRATIDRCCSAIR